MPDGKGDPARCERCRHEGVARHVVSDHLVHCRVGLTICRPAKGGEPWEDEKAGLLAANIDQYGDAVYGVVVGSEGIYRKEYTTAQLLSWIEEMQQAYPDKLIGTADTWSGWSGGSMDPIISSGIKLILANSFPYWQYQDIKNATKTYFDTMSQALGHVQKLTKGGEGIHFINGGEHTCHIGRYLTDLGRRNWMAQ